MPCIGDNRLMRFCLFVVFVSSLSWAGEVGSDQGAIVVEGAGKTGLKALDPTHLPLGQGAVGDLAQNLLGSLETLSQNKDIQDYRAKRPSNLLKKSINK